MCPSLCVPGIAAGRVRHWLNVLVWFSVVVPCSLVVGTNFRIPLKDTPTAVTSSSAIFRSSCSQGDATTARGQCCEDIEGEWGTDLDAKVQPFVEGLSSVVGRPMVAIGSTWV